ncbi:MAG: 3'-5' exonuclease [Bacteroidales bacterium]|nr:3'-5' exonuclease [Bacteroidales bacterium]
MELNLKRPLVFFDIESTGLNIALDSIIELSFVKVFPDGEVRIKDWTVLPWDYENRRQRLSHPSALAVHKISDESLIGKPKFMDVVDEVAQWLEGSDLAGFNSAKFDLPMLAEEIERVRKYTGREVDIDLHGKKMVDVQNIYHKMEPRNLKAAYRFYVGGDFENAHSADADTMATYEVLKGQLEKYPEEQLKNDVDWLADFSGLQKTVDYAGRLIYNAQGEETISFGKHKGKTAREVYFSEPSYFGWIENGEFTLDTKRQFALLKARFDQEKKDAARAKSKPLSGEELSASFEALAGRFNGKLF